MSQTPFSPGYGFLLLRNLLVIVGVLCNISNFEMEKGLELEGSLFYLLLFTGGFCISCFLFLWKTSSYTN